MSRGKPLRIAVVGTVMRDEIHSVHGERRESFGGILYNVLALASLTRDDDRIEPVCYLGADHLKAIREKFFAPHPQIDAAQMRICSTGTDENVLRYRTVSDREEQMTIRTPPLSAAEFHHVADVDAVLFNLINGREVDLEGLRAFRKSTRALLHLDIHNLGKKIDATGKLAPHGLPEWRKWFACVDTVQANEWEVQLLTGTKPESDKEFRDAALELASVPNIKAACVTVGGRGAVLAHRMAPDGRVRVLRVPAIDAGEVVDTTGCGDCFSSAFIVGMLRWNNPARAALLAAVLSGLNTGIGGLDGLASLQGVDDQVPRMLPEMYAQVFVDGWMGD